MKIWENGIIREMTSEEMGQIHKSELLEKSRPLTETEISRLVIMQNINTVITDDATASRAVGYHPEMKYDGSLIRATTRINWKGKLKRASVDLWDTESNNPDNAPTLWEDIAYRNGYRIIPEVITATLAFAEGECGWWGDKLYRSKVNGNAYTPAVYADNWENIMGLSNETDKSIQFDIPEETL